jgi:esterase/lipase superfamily enzyme
MKVRIIAATLSIIIFLPASQPQARENKNLWQADRNRSIGSALDAAVEINSPDARTRKKVVLFVTNRRIDPSAVDRARAARNVLRYEDLFLNELGLSVAYGAAEISYPANRVAGDQSYGTDSVQENPLQHFSVIDHEIVNSPDAFRRLINRLYPAVNNHSLLFVHGLDHTFSEAAERFGQLVVDLEHRGLPLFFSWPSDAHRIQLFGVDYYARSGYLDTRQIAEKSQKYAALAIDELVKQGQPLDIVAHSMGADIAINAILLREVNVSDADETTTKLRLSEAVPLSLVLAAPDISTSEFTHDMQPVLTGTRSVAILAIYCANDRALILSQRYNNSDPRLGYCAADRSPVDSTEMVTVRGNISGISHHSYYLNSPKVLDDMRRVFDAIVPIKGRREILIQ